jgi:hypothetical protein
MKSGTVGWLFFKPQPDLTVTQTRHETTMNPFPVTDPLEPEGSLQLRAGAVAGRAVAGLENAT